MDEETRRVMAQAIDEIRQLRGQNNIMGAQLDVLETVRAIACGPRTSTGMTEDIAWRMQKLLDDTAKKDQ